MRRFAVLIVSMFIVVGCQTTDYIGDETSYRYRIPVGSILTLNQPLTIPADRRSIYIFRGKVVTYKDVDIYYPHCQFKLKNVSNQARTVKPGNFTITKINDWEDYHARGPLRFADAGIYTGVGTDVGTSGRVVISAGGDGGPSIIKYATIISLQSDSQPEVLEIVCAHWGDPGGIYGLEAVTIKETRDTLGKIFTLNLKQVGGAY